MHHIDPRFFKLALGARTAGEQPLGPREGLLGEDSLGLVLGEARLGGRDVGAVDDGKRLSFGDVVTEMALELHDSAIHGSGNSGDAVLVIADAPGGLHLGALGILAHGRHLNVLQLVVTKDHGFVGADGRRGRCTAPAACCQDHRCCESHGRCHPPGREGAEQLRGGGGGRMLHGSCYYDASTPKRFGPT